MQGEDRDTDREVSFTLSAVDYIFELRVPRLQMTASLGISQREREKCSVPSEVIPGEHKDGDKDTGDRDGEKKELRREIQMWWERVADHMDTLVGC
jgi:1-phosphatidylinositol-3-phosphate 5-kinase